VRIILDSGAIIASERNDATLAAILKAARKDRTPILVPATVVAETWRGASTHARTAHLFGSVDGFPELNEQTARRVGALLAISRTAEIVDGNVVAILNGVLDQCGSDVNVGFLFFVPGPHCAQLLHTRGFS